MRLTPADASDLLEMWDADGGLTLKQSRYRALIGQMAAGDAYAVRHEDDPAPLAIGGVVPIGDGVGDSWLVCSRRLPLRLVPVVLLARASLRFFVRGYPGGLWTWVRDENTQGRRLAWLAGFHATQDEVRGHRRWEMRHG